MNETEVLDITQKVDESIKNMIFADNEKDFFEVAKTLEEENNLRYIIQFNYENKQIYFRKGIARWKCNKRIIQPPCARILQEFTSKINVEDTITEFWKEIYIMNTASFYGVSYATAKKYCDRYNRKITENISTIQKPLS